MAQYHLSWRGQPDGTQTGFDITDPQHYTYGRIEWHDGHIQVVHDDGSLFRDCGDSHSASFAAASALIDSRNVLQFPLLVGTTLRKQGKFGDDDVYVIEKINGDDIEVRTIRQRRFPLALAPRSIWNRPDLLRSLRAGSLVMWDKNLAKEVGSP